MNERIIHLRVKIKSLAARSVIIRQEARKTKGMMRWGLNSHRTTVVREHSRNNLLAYGLLRNIPYEVMEKKCRMKPDFSKIAKIAKTFGGDKLEIDAWISKAKEYLTSDVERSPVYASTMQIGYI